MLLTHPIAPHHRLAKWAGIFLLIGVPLAYAHDGHDIVLYTKLLTTQLGTLLMTTAWFLGTIQGHIPRRQYPLDLPILLFLFLYILSWATLAINPFKSALVVTKFYTFVTLYFAISRTYHPSFLKPWVYVITIVAAVISLIGICQYFVIGFLWLRTGGLPSSTLILRNIAAMYLIGIIPISILPFLWASKIKTEIIWGILSTLPIIFLIYTRTRGAWVGLIVALMLSALLWLQYKISNRSTPLFSMPLKKHIEHLTSSIAINKSKCYTTIVLIIFTSIMATLSPKTIEDIHPTTTYTPHSNTQETIRTLTNYGVTPYKQNITDATKSLFKNPDTTRLTLWKNTLKMIQDHWLFGVGIGNWDLIHPQYERGTLTRPDYYAKRPHNDFLLIVAELGIIGLCLFLFLWMKTLHLALFNTSTTHSNTDNLLWRDHNQTIHKCLGISLLATLGHACFSFPFERIPPQVLLYIFMGIMAVHHTTAPPKHTTPKYLILLPILSGLGLVVGILCTSRAIEADRLYDKLGQYHLQKNWSNVILTANQATKHGVINHNIILQKANALYQQGHLPLALETNKKCLTYHPNDMNIHWAIGKIELAQSNLEHAQTALEYAAFLDTDNADIHYDLGTVYQLQGDLDRALQTYKKSISFSKTDPKIYINIGSIYESQNQYNEAIQNYDLFLTQWQGDTTTANIIRKRLQRLESY